MTRRRRSQATSAPARPMRAPAGTPRSKRRQSSTPAARRRAGRSGPAHQRLFQRPHQSARHVRADRLQQQAGHGTLLCAASGQAPLRLRAAEPACASSPTAPTSPSRIRISRPSRNIRWKSTPFRLLLGDGVDLARDARIVGVESGDGSLAVTVEDKNGEAAGQIRLLFETEPEMTLKQWVITDAQGLTTTVNLDNVVPGRKVAADFFTAKVSFSPFR